MPELGSDQFLVERMLRATRDWEGAASGQRNDLESIFQTLACIDISGHNRKRFDLEFRRVQGEQDGHGIVDTGIGVNDHPLGRLRCTRRQKKKNNHAKQNTENEPSIHYYTI